MRYFRLRKRNLRFAALFLSLILMLFDYHSASSSVSASSPSAVSSSGLIRTSLNTLVYWFIERIETTINWPLRSFAWLMDRFVSQNELLSRIEELQSENLLFKGRMQELVAARFEIERYKALFDFAYQVQFDSFLFVRIVRHHRSFLKKGFLINKGIKHEVYLGQPLIGREGIVGQVSELGWAHSFVTLITDPKHAIHVESFDGSVQGILRGNGEGYLMSLEYVSKDVVVQVGEKLYSSGKGQVFPKGYPVARVAAVESDAGPVFLKIRAKPNAVISDTTESLLIWPKRDEVLQ